MIAKGTLCTSLIIGVIATPLSMAADKTGGFAAYGNGNKSCGNYVSDRTEKSDNYYRTWFVGFVSAYNEMSVGNYDILGSTDLEGAMLWMENYCRTNPLSSFNVATQSLITTLYPNRKKIGPPE